MQRQLETRMRVVRTLERLMQSTPIDKIKVTDLCREADIGRATFYESTSRTFTPLPPGTTAIFSISRCTS